MSAVNGFTVSEDYQVIHCGVPAEWRDCSSHEEDCFEVVCSECFAVSRDCDE